MFLLAAEGVAGVEGGEALPPRVEVHRYQRGGRLALPGSSILAGRSIQNVLRRLDVDLLHAHYASSFGWLARLVGFRPTVVTAWGSDLLTDPARSWRAAIRVRQAVRHADLVTVPSEQLRSRAIELGAEPNRVERVPFGVDTSEFSPDSATGDLEPLGLGGHRIIFSPRALRPLYRHETVLRAFAKLPEDVLLVMTGRGANPAYREGLQALAEELHIAHRLRLIEEIEQRQMLALLRGSAAVLSVPASDGLPISVLEAMACGTPVVISDLPGPSEALGPMAERLAVPLADGQALADRLNEVLTLPAAEREELGRALRRRAVESFDREAAMLHAERLYRSLVAAASA